MQRFRSLSRRAQVLIVVSLLVYIATWSLVGFTVGRQLAQSQEPKIKIGSLINKDVVPTLADFANPINGIWYTQAEAKSWKDRLPIASVIENHTDARPQSGFGKADVVYETLAEGGITRCLAIFLSQDSAIGPVRSNRPYFLDWVSEYTAGYAHIGGSPLAQGLVKKYKIRDLDQFFLGAPTYQRTNNRFAPHNVYTSTSKLRGAAATRGYKGPVKIDSWIFTDEELKLAERPKKFTLNLGFLGAYGYDVKWVYQRATNTYLRFNGGVKHTDTVTKRQLSAKTIIVQRVTVKAEPSGHSRILLGTIGSGKAQVFRDGKVITGTWKKRGRTTRTKFFDKTGKEIPLNRGQIWVEVVPADSSVSYK